MKTYLKKNKKKILVAQKTKFHIGIISKGIGLMLRKSIRGQAHFFPFKKSKKIGVTMMFMRIPIDIIFLKDTKVVELKENLKPWHDYYPKNKADTLLELEQGSIKKHDVELNDEIVFAKN